MTLHKMKCNSEATSKLTLEIYINLDKCTAVLSMTHVLTNTLFFIRTGGQQQNRFGRNHSGLICLYESRGQGDSR